MIDDRLPPLDCDTYQIHMPRLPSGLRPRAGGTATVVGAGCAAGPVPAPPEDGPPEDAAAVAGSAQASEARAMSEIRSGARPQARAASSAILQSTTEATVRDNPRKS